MSLKMSKNQQILAKIGGSLALLLSLGLGQQASAVTLVENLSKISDGCRKNRELQLGKLKLYNWQWQL
jgi:hypothetical protein